MAKVKICTKGHRNDPMQTFCTAPDCYEPLSGVEAVEVREAIESSPPQAQSESSDKAEQNHTKVFRSQARLECMSQSGFSFEILPDHIAGRTGEIDLTMLASSEYISGKHAQFMLVNGQWQIKALSKTNNTTVNQILIPEGEICPLNEGDHITLANTTFIFRIAL